MNKIIVLKRGFEESSLGTLFANAYFGNSVIAILAGILAQFAASYFGYVYVLHSILNFCFNFIFVLIRAPFDLSLFTLIIMVVFIVMYWNENYGDAHADVKQSFITAWNSILSGL